MPTRCRHFVDGAQTRALSALRLVIATGGRHVCLRSTFYLRNENVQSREPPKMPSSDSRFTKML